MSDSHKYEPQNSWEEKVAQIYLEHLGRDGDEGGVQYWAGELAKNPSLDLGTILDGTQEGQTYSTKKQDLENFLTTRSPEEIQQLLNGDGADSKYIAEHSVLERKVATSIVQGEYIEHLGRVGDDGGVSFWAGQLSLNHQMNVGNIFERTEEGNQKHQQEKQRITDFVANHNAEEIQALLNGTGPGGEVESKYISAHKDLEAQIISSIVEKEFNDHLGRQVTTNESQHYTQLITSNHKFDLDDVLKNSDEGRWVISLDTFCSSNSVADIQVYMNRPDVINAIQNYPQLSGKFAWWLASKPHESDTTSTTVVTPGALDSTNTAADTDTSIQVVDGSGSQGALNTASTHQHGQVPEAIHDFYDSLNSDDQRLVDLYLAGNRNPDGSPGWSLGQIIGNMPLSTPEEIENHRKLLNAALNFTVFSGHNQNWTQEAVQEINPPTKDWVAVAREKIQNLLPGEKISAQDIFNLFQYEFKYFNPASKGNWFNDPLDRPEVAGSKNALDSLTAYAESVYNEVNKGLPMPGFNKNISYEITDNTEGGIIEQFGKELSNLEAGIRHAASVLVQDDLAKLGVISIALAMGVPPGAIINAAQKSALVSGGVAALRGQGVDGTWQAMVNGAGIGAAFAGLGYVIGDVTKGFGAALGFTGPTAQLVDRLATTTMMNGDPLQSIVTLGENRFNDMLSKMLQAEGFNVTVADTLSASFTAAIQGKDPTTAAVTAGVDWFLTPPESPTYGTSKVVYRTQTADGNPRQWGVFELIAMDGTHYDVKELREATEGLDQNGKIEFLRNLGVEERELVSTVKYLSLPDSSTMDRILNNINSHKGASMPANLDEVLDSVEGYLTNGKGLAGEVINDPDDSRNGSYLDGNIMVNLAGIANIFEAMPEGPEKNQLIQVYAEAVANHEGFHQFFNSNGSKQLLPLNFSFYVEDSNYTGTPLFGPYPKFVMTNEIFAHMATINGLGTVIETLAAQTNPNLKMIQNAIWLRQVMIQRIEAFEDIVYSATPNIEAAITSNPEAVRVYTRDGYSFAEVSIQTPSGKTEVEFQIPEFTTTSQAVDLIKQQISLSQNAIDHFNRTVMPYFAETQFAYGYLTAEVVNGKRNL